MPPIARERPTLADATILVAANALSLACFLFMDDNLYDGGRFFFGVLHWEEPAWNSWFFLDKAQGAFSLLASLFGAWTPALPILALRRPRARRLRLLRGPGLTACVAASAGIAFCIAATLGAFAVRWVEGRLTLPPNFWYSTPILETLFILAGVAVASTWAVQGLSGRWRPSPDLFDRLGRVVGASWLAAGLVFAVRLYLG